VKSIALLAKGASVERLIDVALHCDSIASINDALRVIPDHNVEFCFYSDARVYETIVQFDDRIQKYVTRDPMDDDFAAVPECIKKKWITYPDRFCNGDIKSLQIRLLSGGICHHSTVPAAIHWLCKHTEYQNIVVIGVDGGGDYAKDMWRLGQADLYLWRTIALRTAAICENVYGKTIRFRDARSDPS
jgi:hypothetical protein